MRKALGISAALALCVAAPGTAALACEMYDSLEIEISFEFEIGGKVLPAGAYTISRTDPAIATPLRIVEKGTNKGTLFGVEDVSAETLPTSTHMVFSEADGKHHLHQIWLESEKTGCQVVQKHQHQKHHKKKHVEAETVGSSND